MNIISYNVNGLRAAVSKGFFEWLKKEDPEIICIQETKLQEGQIDTKPIEDLGYYHYWHYAVKKGYSGVALFCKTKPDEIFYGIGVDAHDSEGRSIFARFGDTWVASVYFPSGSSGEERQDVKMSFLDDFLKFITHFKSKNSRIIVSGDYNICHKPIDINHPEKHNDYSGFLPEEREWMDRYESSGFIDSFRVFNQQPNQYSWWSYRANSRSKNLGWRIDYHWVSDALKPKLINASILNDIMFSDHCPVKVEVRG